MRLHLRSTLLFLLAAGSLLAIVSGRGVLSAGKEREEPEYPHGEFQEDCSLCHSAGSWSPAIIGEEFDHSERGFALKGAHTQAACRACHESLDFRMADTSCVGCHLDVHRGELGTDCGRCHTTTNFIDRARMARAHVATRFPLVASHRVADCQSCHPLVSQNRMQYVNTPVECEACHAEEYLATTNPDHQASGFPRTCEVCHSPTIWSRAIFNHDDLFFPIYSGEHRGKWADCSDCHVSGGGGAFDCLQCHDDPVDLAGKHSGMTGYQYLSSACYGCHPRGEGD